MTKVQLRTFAEAEAALQPYIPIVKQMTGKDITLQRMQPLMARLGNPERKLRVIHVAGTSGKTSTSYYTASLLHAAGKTVGLTVSPHIDVISERLQVNLEPLSEAVFCSVLSEFLELIESVEPLPSYFELLIAMAYWYFAKLGVDYAVIETGFGGLHDASNICQNPNKVCVLTDIGFDHTHILGNSLEQISLQKAGIMHPGNQAFTFEQNPDVISVFESYAKSVDAALHVLKQRRLTESVQDNGEFTHLPTFQQRNWTLAFGVYQYIAKRDDLLNLSMAQLAATMQTRVPGRMDIWIIDNTQLVMDGAHNEQKIKAFAESFAAAFPGVKVPILLGMKQGKEYADVLPLLRPLASRLILTTFDINQDLRSRPIDPQVLAGQARLDGFSDVLVEPNTAKALQAILEEKPNMAIVTGSFYLLANIRRLML